MRNWTWLRFLTACVFLLLPLSFGGCDCDNNEEPLEETGEQVEEAAEETGEAVEEAAEETGDALEDMGDEN